MTEYKDFLKAFDNDAILLDVHLSNLYIEEDSFLEYKQILITSTNSTKRCRTNWGNYKVWAFDTKVIEAASYQEITDIQKGRRLSYKANESGIIARYKQLLQE